MKIPENYKNREQAYVKHALLKPYLESLFMIIGQSQDVIRYVDCFSGPWNEKSERLEDTSISISIEAMKKCKEGLKRSFHRDVSFQALFIEKDKDAFKKLESFLNSTGSDIQTDTRNGNFYELREEILNWCGHQDFTFFFIDPTGWKNVIEVPTLEPLLRRPNSEYLINFMYDFLLRTHTQTSFQEDMKAIFGHVPDTSGMEPKEKEVYLIRAYCSQLKQIAPSRGGKPRSTYVRILYPIRDRTYYHLVYLTRHAKGLVVFMNESEKLEFVQKEIREQAKKENRESRSGQREFDFKFNTPSEKIETIDLIKVENYWLKRLSEKPCLFGTKQLADMIEQTGWFESDFQLAFGELAKKKMVNNLSDTTKRRRKKYVYFDAEKNSGEYLVRLKA